MKVLKTDDVRTAARAAVAALKRGGVIAFPTETTYGLGCDPRNAKAVARIFKMKGRTKTKSLPLVAASLSQVRRIAKRGAMSDEQRATSHELMVRYWPGPLTLVLPIRKGGRRGPPLPKSIAPRGEVAIRVSSSPFVRAVCRAHGFPIVATSANQSGEPECRSGAAVVRVFRSKTQQPDLVIDMGALPRRKPSTVARVREDGTVEVLRQGAIRL